MVGIALQEEKSASERPSSPCSTRCLRYPDVEVTMFCPQCKAEYRVGFIRCSDCDVELVAISLSRNRRHNQSLAELLNRIVLRQNPNSSLFAPTKVALMPILQNQSW